MYQRLAMIEASVPFQPAQPMMKVTTKRMI